MRSGGTTAPAKSDGEYQMTDISIFDRNLLQNLRGRLVYALVAFVVWCSAPIVAVAQTAEPLILGVHPYLSASEIINRFSPLSKLLAVALDRPVTVSVSPDYENHIKRIANGSVDIAYIGPAAYVTLTHDHGPQTLLARLSVSGAPQFYGYIVVRTDSPLSSVGDLKGKRFAFGDEQSTMSHHVPHAMLMEAHVNKQDMEHHAFVGSHENVALSVLAGAFDAGGVKEEVFHAYRDKGLRALAKSPPVSEHLFITPKRLSGKEVGLVRETLLSLATTDQGLEALKAIKRTADALVAVSDSDYDPLRKMLAQTRNEP